MGSGVLGCLINSGNGLLLLDTHLILTANRLLMLFIKALPKIFKSFFQILHRVKSILAPLVNFIYVSIIAFTQ